MPTRQQVHYFGAGPAPLPTPVLEAGAAAFLNFDNTGLSLAEISHRSPTANKILADTKADLAKLLDIPDSYEILFCHGGGTGGFGSVVHNLVAHWVERRRLKAEKDLGAGKEAEVLARVKKEVEDELKLDYLVTGSWSLKASQEAANLLEPLGKDKVNVAFDARKFNGGKFGVIPAEAEWKLTPTKKENGTGSALVYYCDNETVDGVEFPGFPKSLEAQGQEPEDERLVVADMSSNFLSRAVDVSKYAAVFGGAQKNIGITDVTLLIVRKEVLQIQPAPAFLHALGIFSPPVVMHWPTLAKNNSLYNTLPIFSVYIAGLVLAALLKKHGPLSTGSQDRESREKADTIYKLLDAHPEAFEAVNDKSVRSRMNLCFKISGEGEEKRFLEGAEQRQLLGVKGHRSVGGIRVSNYNAVSTDSVKLVADWMEEFLKTKK